MSPNTKRMKVHEHRYHKSVFLSHSAHSQSHPTRGIWAFCICLDISAFVILALSFGASEDFFGSEAAYAFEQTSLSKLATHSLVDAVLHCVDVFITCDLRLGEVVW